MPVSSGSHTKVFPALVLGGAFPAVMSLRHSIMVYMAQFSYRLTRAILAADEGQGLEEHNELHFLRVVGPKTRDAEFIEN